MATKAKDKVAAPAGHARVDVKPLRGAVKAVGGVIEKRNTVPILAGLLMRSGPSTMTLTGTDLDMEISYQIDLAEAGQGKAMRVVAGSAVLDKIMAKLPADALMTMEEDTDARQIKVSCGRSRFTLPLMDADEFPEITQGGFDHQFEMMSAEFQAMMNAVRFAMSTEETRYYLMGIYLHVADGKLAAAATDGHRLARWVGELPDGAEGMPGVIIPRKAVAVLDSLLDAVEQPKIEIGVSATRMRVDVGGVSFTTKMVDGQFPDYTRVIPVANDKSLWMDPKALIEAVDRVATVADGKTKAVKFTLSDGGDCPLTLSCRSLENGNAEEEVEGQYDGDALEIGFNAAYLTDVLRHLTAEPALIKFSDGAGPVLLVDAEDARRTYVVMPMRV
ncbi:MAG: DNA polymerase III subunit beta [Sphingobium sp.]|nr:DNA polymerase III subunit beta [Sphingobium sp.]